jgi:hypothetical protein
MTNATLQQNKQSVTSMVQVLLLNLEDRSTITPTIIDQMIDRVVGLNPKWGEGLDRKAVADELIRRFSVWVGQDTTLKSEAGHEAWLTADRKRVWRYWQRYREYMERSLSPDAISALDKSTDTVLSLMEDPTRDGGWDRRGLVVGHVQSGKTGNYAGLICKAADAGYKIVIVLAGLHNNLRSQTQIRLDEAFLGYETKPDARDLVITGVGEIDSDNDIRPNYVTNRSDRGDFNATVAKNLGITPEKRAWLFVVKKNKSVLHKLLTWIRNHVANSKDPQSGQKIVTNLPLLLIDDEADHASVDTGEQVFDSDGQPDRDHEPTAINRLIRRILNSFSRSAYVGYTATPFANIFIHERGETTEEGPDLFPSAFIINLAAPSNYVGPARVFGLLTPQGRQDGLPLVRVIGDQAAANAEPVWMPKKHNKDHRPRHGGAGSLPPSLVEAIDCFALACAARRVRGDEHEHSSMLIHVTRFNAVQQEVCHQVDKHVQHVRQAITRGIDDNVQIHDRMRMLWEADFLANHGVVRAACPDQVPAEPETWEQIRAVLPDALAEIKVKMINGTAKDALDYADHKATGLKVIAIGGDKLARGLTLEGLCVSYFLRASKMYDTLMQMGRWFGYRPGYLDLSRLYTTDELVTWFGHITDAAEELRDEFELMASSGGTPRDYGLKVQSHPVLMVTSPLKMQSSRNLHLSFSGEVLETVLLFRDARVLQSNLVATRTLLAGLGPAEVNPERSRGLSKHHWDGYLWNSVPVRDVLAFLGSYQTHPKAHKVHSALIAQFIESMVQAGELSQWKVALIGGGKGEKDSDAVGCRVDLQERKPETKSVEHYSIGRLLSPRDEAIDLSDEEWQAALMLTQQAWRSDPGRSRRKDEPDAPSGPCIRRVRGFGADGIPGHPERGLLLIYLLDPKSAGQAEGSPPIVALGFSFPSSNAGRKVEYCVNNVLWESEYGPAE